MANTLGNYNVEYYARQALAYLRTRKGMARIVNRQIEGERRASWEQGQVVNVRRPSTFTAAQVTPGTGTSAQDLKPQNITITLDQWYETKFNATDDELAYAGPKLVQEHIGPAVESIARKIEQTLFALTAKVGPSVNIHGASGAENIIVPSRKKLSQNKTPMDANIYMALDDSLEAEFLKDPIFHQAQVVGDGSQSALIDGMVGRRFGVNMFGSQDAYTDRAQATGTLAANAGTGDEVGALNGNHDVNSTSLAIDGLTNGETLEVNVDTFTIAGDDTVYKVVGVSGAVAGGAVTVTCYPPLQKYHADNDVVTFANRTAQQDAAAGTRENLIFHRDALALVMAPLPMDGNGAGAEIFTAVDEQSGLAVRVRRFYEGAAARNNVAVDALWGVQAINTQMAARLIRAVPS